MSSRAVAGCVALALVGAPSGCGGSGDNLSAPIYSAAVAKTEAERLLADIPLPPAPSGAEFVVIGGEAAATLGKHRTLRKRADSNEVLANE